MGLVRSSPCKVNLLLNILGKRSDGFHELETVFQPVPISDELDFTAIPQGIELTCSNPGLPCDSSNLVWRAAAAFLEAARISGGVRIHHQKSIPMAAGLGGGSGNAAATLLGLNELFGSPLAAQKLAEIAASLGSDIPFFLQPNPALGTGRGEKIQSLAPFELLQGCWILLFHPGFGISTPWAYQQLRRFPAALNGEKGRAERLIARLRGGSRAEVGREFYNSLEAPALEKFPILQLYQDHFRSAGAFAALMSGSGSTTFALFETKPSAEQALETFKIEFGQTGWSSLAAL